MNERAAGASSQPTSSTSGRPCASRDLAKMIIMRGGASVRVTVDVHQRFSSVDSVCLDFTFANDPLDPGEQMVITPLELGPSLTGGGFTNIEPGAQSERVLCTESIGDQAFGALFIDGKETMLDIAMVNGSVQIASLIVTVTGTPR